MLRFIIDALAVWRLASMLVHEDGPWYIFKRLRERTGFQYYDDGAVLVEPDNHVLGCVWCASVWVALGLALLPKQVRYAFALSAAAVLVQERGIGKA